MTNEPPDTAGDTAVRGGADDRRTSRRMPCWVLVIGLVAGLLILLAVLRLTGIGVHGDNGQEGGHGAPHGLSVPGATDPSVGR
jgi:hypothetical protein